MLNRFWQTTIFTFFSLFLIVGISISPKDKAAHAHHVHMGCQSCAKISFHYQNFTQKRTYFALKDMMKKLRIAQRTSRTLSKNV